MFTMLFAIVAVMLVICIGLAMLGAVVSAVAMLFLPGDE